MEQVRTTRLQPYTHRTDKKKKKKNPRKGFLFYIYFKKGPLDAMASFGTPAAMSIARAVTSATSARAMASAASSMQEILLLAYAAAPAWARVTGSADLERGTRIKL